MLQPCSSDQILWLLVIMYGCSQSLSRLTGVSKSMSPRRVQWASIGFVNFVVSESHLMMDQWQHFCTLLSRLASTTAMQSLQGHQSRSLTSYNECSMLPPVWSVIHGSLIAVWRHSCTMSFIGWMCQRGSVTTYKLGVMIYRSFHGQAPRYLADHLITSSEVASRLWRLRLHSASYLAVDSTHTAVGTLAFSIAGPLELAAWWAQRTGV